VRPLVIDQGTFFIYYALDLAHAAGQPAAAARAAVRQLEVLRASDPALARRLSSMTR
jgi:hypothetical protein